MLDPQKMAMMKEAADRATRMEEFQTVQLIATISMNREKMMDGPASTASSNAIVQQCDRLLLRWVNSMVEGSTE